MEATEMHLTREHKLMIGFGLAGVVVGIVLSRARLSANMSSLARVAIAGVHTGQRLGLVNPEKLVANAMRGVVATWGTRGNFG